MRSLKKSSLVLFSFFCLFILLTLASKTVETTTPSHTIETTRFNINRLNLSDVEDWYNSMGGKESSNPFWQKGENIDTIKDRFENEILPIFKELEKRDNPLLRYTIRLKEDNSFVGQIFFDGIDKFGYSEITYNIAQRFWGQGVATESVGALLTYVKPFIGTEINFIDDIIDGIFIWEKRILKSIWARVLDSNTASIKICQRFLYSIDRLETYEKKDNESLFILDAKGF